MAYNLNSWGDLLVSGFAFAVANPALIVLHSKKKFAVDGKLCFEDWSGTGE